MIDLTKTIDLSTTYLGLKLKNPLVASSSPMCREVGNIRRLEDAGASAIVLHSLLKSRSTSITTSSIASSPRVPISPPNPLPATSRTCSTR